MTDETQADRAGDSSPALDPPVDAALAVPVPVPAPASAEPIGPLAPEERVHFIDVLRGLALFGIIAANLRGFAAPMQVYFNPKLLWTALPDRVAQFLLEVLIQGKFITIFAFLFGLGFAVQLARAQARGAKFLGFYSRRLFALLLIGLAHELILWWGDILVPYALGGFVLMLFRKRKDKTILVWALILVAMPLLLAAAYVLAQQLGAPVPKFPKRDPAEIQAKVREVIRIYQQGSVKEIFFKRIDELKPQYGALPLFLPNVIGTFLLGMWTWRKGILQDLGAHLALLRRTTVIGISLGLAGNLAGRIFAEMQAEVSMTPSPSNLVIWTLQLICVPALSLGYASALALLYQSDAWRIRLTPFAAVGRTALSNYLLQSLICTTIFYSYGLGFYGKGGPLIYLIPAFVIFALQVPLSQGWLNRYRFGPAEWVWRSMTYGRLPPLRR